MFVTSQGMTGVKGTEDGPTALDFTTFSTLTDIAIRRVDRSTTQLLVADGTVVRCIDLKTRMYARHPRLYPVNAVFVN
jgi:hypothetical protein